MNQRTNKRASYQANKQQFKDSHIITRSIRCLMDPIGNPKHESIQGNSRIHFLIVMVMTSVAASIVSVTAYHNFVVLPGHEQVMTRKQGYDVDGLSLRGNVNGNGNVLPTIATVTTTTTTTTDLTKSECLDSDETLDAAISAARHTYIIMPPKAAGTSMIAFTKSCLADKYPNFNFYGVQHSLKKPAYAKDQFYEYSKFPPFVSGHIVSHESTANLIANLPRKDLIIYLHRDEESRLQSAIKHVTYKRICGESGKKFGDEDPKEPAVKLNEAEIAEIRAREPLIKRAEARPKESVIKLNETHCILDEHKYIDIVLKEKAFEIGHGADDLLNCNFYESIEDHEPNMIMVHYKKAGKIMDGLARQFCPELVGKNIIQNSGQRTRHLVGEGEGEGDSGSGSEGEGEGGIFLKSPSGKLVEIHEWLENKGGAIDWALQMNEHGTCTAKTRHMEDELFGCAGEILKVSSKMANNW